MSTLAPGIHQSDIIVRTAIIEAIADVRRNPWLLNYVFASLRQDALTRSVYGEREIDAAKRWFMRTNLPVFMVTRQDGPQLPGISIELQESVELEQTLGDVNYDSSEPVEAEWPVLAGPFTPVQYDGGTGTIVLPKSVTDELVVVPGMLVVDAVGGQHPVISVGEAGEVVIASGSSANFSGATIQAVGPRLIAALESVSCRETYVIGCHVQGEPRLLTYLHSIVVFVLWRYKQSLLEARGFERSTLSSTQFQRNHDFEVELAYSRFVSLTGYVRQFWPKIVTDRLTTVGAQLTFGTDGTAGPGVTEDGALPTSDTFWSVDRDALALPGRTAI